MKSIQATFTDEEHAKIEKKKKDMGLNWHDFILSILKK